MTNRTHHSATRDESSKRTLATEVAVLVRELPLDLGEDALARGDALAHSIRQECCVLVQQQKLNYKRHPSKGSSLAVGPKLEGWR